MSPTAIGRRNVRGTIYAVTKAQDETGFEVETPEPLGVEWVAIVPLRAGEFVQAQQTFGQATALLRMRYRSDVDETMHFVADDGAAWDFIAPPVDPDGRRREMEIVVGRSA